VAGVPADVAPEHRADMFAWPITFFAATGRPPFGNDTIPLSCTGSRTSSPI
jgi:hypothetical protein